MSALITIAALLTTNQAYADLIITKSGESITAFNIEIGSKNIFYTLNPDDDSSVKIAVEDVFGYKIGNGEMQTVSTQSTNKSNAVQEKQSAPIAEPTSAAADNSSLILSYSAGDYGFDKKPENNEAKRAIIFYKPTSNSVLSNNDITISLEAGLIIDNGEWQDAFSLSRKKDRDTRATSQCHLRIGITNKTENSIYVDLSKTVRNGEIPGGYRAFYDGTTTTEGNSTSTGVGMNVMGIGVGVGSSSGNSISKTQHNILLIPPHATVYLPPYSFLSEYDKKIYYEHDRLSYTKQALSTTNKFGDMTQGQILDFDESTSPSMIDYTITYSFDPKISSLRYAPFSLYISRAIGLKTLFNIWSGKYEDRLNRITGLDPKALVGAVFLK